MNILETFQLLGSNIWIYGGTFLLVLGILVFVHEWGHYIVARMCGIKVETFSIGFGKELFGFNDKSGTRWKISLIPLGGFRKLFGDVDPASFKNIAETEDPDTHKLRELTPAEREMAFFAKPVWKRACVVAAGPGINYVFAIFLMACLFSFSGQPVTPPIAGATIGGSSAEKHGFKPQDLVISIDGRKIDDFEDIRREMLISLDEERHFVVERNGKDIDIYARPQKVEASDRFGFKHSRGMLGLISPRHAVDVSMIKKIDGVVYTNTAEVIKALKHKMGSNFVIEVQYTAEKDVLNVSPATDFNKTLGDETAKDKGKILYLSDTTKAQELVKYSPPMAVVKALEQTWYVTGGTLEAIGQIVTGTRSPTELGGVIRIGALAGDMAQQGLIALIFFTALLSINLGLINLFPIPVLDGGHLLFYALEAIMGKPVPPKIQEYAFNFGFTFLIFIMVYANLSDIMQLNL